jgi:hypothetical protein
MAPSIAVESPLSVPSVDKVTTSIKNALPSGLIREPLKYSGSLDEYQSLDITPVIGREFPTLELTDILDDDRKLRDLAILGMNIYKKDFIGHNTAFLTRSLHCSIPTRRVVFSQPEYRLRSTKGSWPETGRVNWKTRNVQSEKYNRSLHLHDY